MVYQKLLFGWIAYRCRQAVYARVRLRHCEQFSSCCIQQWQLVRSSNAVWKMAPLFAQQKIHHSSLERALQKIIFVTPVNHYTTSRRKDRSSFMICEIIARKKIQINCVNLVCLARYRHLSLRFTPIKISSVAIRFITFANYAVNGLTTLTTVK